MKNNLEELVNWNSTAGICHLWENQNPLLMDGISILINKSFKLESRLQNEYELLCMKHTHTGIKMLITAILATIATAIVASGLWVMAAMVVFFVISMFWINHMEKNQVEIHNERTLHTNRILEFNVYVSRLSNVLKIDIEDLFVYPGEQLKNMAETTLQDVATSIKVHLKAGDTKAEAEDRKWFNFRYDLFVSGGLVKLGTYGNYFSQPVFVENN
jgi:hypothetical protein